MSLVEANDQTRFSQPRDLRFVKGKGVQLTGNRLVRSKLNSGNGVELDPNNIPGNWVMTLIKRNSSKGASCSNVEAVV